MSISQILQKVYLSNMLIVNLERKMTKGYTKYISFVLRDGSGKYQ